MTLLSNIPYFAVRRRSPATGAQIVGGVIARTNRRPPALTWRRDRASCTAQARWYPIDT